MASIGKYLRDQRDNIVMPPRKVYAETYFDTSFLCEIDGTGREAARYMLQIFSKLFKRDFKEVELKFVINSVVARFSELKHHKAGLN